MEKLNNDWLTDSTEFVILYISLHFFDDRHLLPSLDFDRTIVVLTVLWLEHIFIYISIDSLIDYQWVTCEWLTRLHINERSSSQNSRSCFSGIRIIRFDTSVSVRYAFTRLVSFLAASFSNQFFYLRVRICPEIWDHIFIQAYLAIPSFVLQAKFSCDLTHVCSHWRRIAITQPFLWHVLLDIMTENQITSFVSRAGASDLWLVTSDHTLSKELTREDVKKLRRLFKFLLEYRDRIGLLQSCGSLPLTILIDVIHKGATELPLTLRSTKTIVVSNHTSDLMELGRFISTPSLTEASLDNVLPPPNSSSLTTFTFLLGNFQSYRDWDPSQLATILDSLPALIFLEIRLVNVVVVQRSVVPRIVTKVEQLIILAASPDDSLFLHLLNPISFPNLTSLRVLTVYDESTDFLSRFSKENCPQIDTVSVEMLGSKTNTRSRSRSRNTQSVINIFHDIRDLSIVGGRFFSKPHRSHFVDDFRALKRLHLIACELDRNSIAPLVDRLASSSRLTFDEQGNLLESGFGLLAISASDQFPLFPDAARYIEDVLGANGFDFDVIDDEIWFSGETFVT